MSLDSVEGEFVIQEAIGDICLNDAKPFTASGPIRWDTRFRGGPPSLLEEGDGDPEIVGQAPV